MSQIISSLDILNKLSQVESNENLIGSLLSDQSSIYDQLVSYLSLHDIHLLISTLECLYALSCHGEVTCNAIARTHGALEILVSLVTVEAQSYGPKACILMRVVETVPGSNATTMHPQQTQLQPLAAPQPAPIQPPTVPAAIAVAPPSTNGLKPDQLAQLGQLTPIQPPQPQQPPPQVVTMSVGQQQPQQQMSIMGQQALVRGQLVQVPTAQPQVVQTQHQPIMQLPRHPLPVLRPGQPAPGTVVVSQGQPQQQQIQIQPKGQMAGGSIIITTTPNSVQPQQLQIQQMVQAPQQIQIQQQQVQQAVLQHQHPQIRPAIIQNVVRPVMTQQPQVQLQQQPQVQLTQQPQVQLQQQQPHLPQQPQVQLPQQPVQPPSGPQQVQLRVSNDDANRQFCLSWLKATYELAAGSSIEQQVMYKQYLASLHKLGKREVISAQHYAVCVRYSTFPYQKYESIGAVYSRSSILASRPAAQGSIPGVPKKISVAKLSMLLRLINALVRGKLTVA